MSGTEEPPAKITKIVGSEEMDHYDGEDDDMGDGQEEWLSESALTDDDFNPTVDQETMDTNATVTTMGSQECQDDVTPDLDDPTLMEQLAALDQKENGQEKVENTQQIKVSEVPAAPISEFQKLVDQTVGDGQQPESEAKDEMQSIEAELSSFNVLTDDLDDLLARRTDSKLLGKEEKGAATAINQDNEDGNDTDDLLRLLGDDDTRVKKKVMVKKPSKKEAKDNDSSDDEFAFENASSVKTLRVARNVMMKGRPASKAVPEDMSDDENYTESSEEARTVKKMFEVPQAKKNVLLKNQVGGKPVVKRLSKVDSPLNISNCHLQPALKQYGNKNQQAKSTLRSAPSPKSGALKVEGKPATSKSESNSKTPSKPEMKLRMSHSKQHFSPKVQSSKGVHSEPDENDEIIDEDGFLEDEDDFLLDEEEFGEESDEEIERGRQRIMKPEQMDEEAPSDMESHTEDGSLYDEIPSSDSEDLDDWFTFDIRAERASDYLPLLGPNAKELLLEEKKRMVSRLSSLRQSLSALTESGRKQAEQIRRDSMTLAELDDMLKAT